MSDTQPNVTPDEKPAETPEVEAPATPEAPAAEVVEEAADESEENPDEKADDLPEWARKSLSKANDEAAKFRTQLRDLQAKLEGAKTPEEFAAATQELGEANATLTRELAVEKALRKHGLDDADTVFVVGSTPEEIEASAKAFAERVGSGEPVNLRGGLNPDGEDDASDDPGELAKQFRKNRF